MNWQPALLDNWKGIGIDYTGIDIVPELIAANNARFAEQANWKFQVGNIITDQIPKCDFLMVRDCFVHLTNDMIKQALLNIASSDVKFVALTTFPAHENGNYEPTPEQWADPQLWRPLNMALPPFLLPFPKYQCIEQCTEADGIFADKCLSVWTINQIRERCSQLISSAPSV
jgi:hypothetical protein